MPSIDLTDLQVSDIAAWLHSLAVTSRTDPNAENIDIVTGDAHAGQLYFGKTCASCHSVTGDLKGFGSKFRDPKMLQQWWLMPGSGQRGTGARRAVVPAGLHVPPTIVTVTMRSGEKIEGELSRMDDFDVWVTMPDGSVRGIDRVDGHPKIDIKDPLIPHRDLLLKYTDDDIHNMTAYLVTLK